MLNNNLKSNKKSKFKNELIKAGFGASGTVFRVCSSLNFNSKSTAGLLLGISVILWIRTIFLMPFKNFKKGKNNALSHMTIIATRDAPSPEENDYHGDVKHFVY